MLGGELGSQSVIYLYEKNYYLMLKFNNYKDRLQVIFLNISSSETLPLAVKGQRHQNYQNKRHNIPELELIS